jgi:hypothetical protein
MSLTKTTNLRRKRKRAAELVIQRLAFKTKKKSAAELINANKLLFKVKKKLKRAAELIAAKKKQSFT